MILAAAEIMIPTLEQVAKRLWTKRSQWRGMVVVVVAGEMISTVEVAVVAAITNPMVAVEAAAMVVAADMAKAARDMAEEAVDTATVGMDMVAAAAAADMVEADVAEEAVDTATVGMDMVAAAAAADMVEAAVNIRIRMSRTSLRCLPEKTAQSTQTRNAPGSKTA
jgi:hypothetical protein